MSKKFDVPPWFVDQGLTRSARPWHSPKENDNLAMTLNEIASQPVLRQEMEAGLVWYNLLLWSVGLVSCTKASGVG
jgi:hypothetical protein